MSKLLERLRSKKDNNRNRGNRKGEGPKPMHSKKKQKEFEAEQVKSDYLEAAGKKERSTEDDITSILETQGKAIPKKGYIDQTSMHSAVQRWKSDTPLMQKEDMQKVESKKATTISTKTKAPELRSKKVAEEGEINKKEREAKEAKKKKRKADATKATNTLGKALEHFATGEASETATERKEKKKSEEAKREKTKVKNVFDEKLDNTITTDSDEGKKEVVKVDSSTASTAPTKRKGSPFTLQNLGPEVETKKKRGINPAAAALGGAALGGLAVHLINKKKDK